MPVTFIYEDELFKVRRGNLVPGKGTVPRRMVEQAMRAAARQVNSVHPDPDYALTEAALRELRVPKPIEGWIMRHRSPPGDSAPAGTIF